MTKSYSAVLIVAAFSLAQPAYSWGPLAHALTVEDGHDLVLRHRVNLPDMWDSWQPFFPGGAVAGGEITRFFGWSHACHRNGLLTLDVQVIIPEMNPLYGGQVFNIGTQYPETPTWYGAPPGVDRPGHTMYFLIKNKLKDCGGPNETVMLNTARGFAAHNAADRVVHFDVFQGGTIKNWIDHSVKESWAEFIIYIFDGGWWDEWGTPTKIPGVHATGNPGIINLAQKVFRKNRHTVDAVPDSTGQFRSIDIETAQAISDRISGKAQDLQNLTWHEAAWILLALYADNQEWNATDILSSFADARAAVNASLHVMP